MNPLMPWLKTSINGDLLLEGIDPNPKTEPSVKANKTSLERGRDPSLKLWIYKNIAIIKSHISSPRVPCFPKAITGWSIASHKL